MSLKTRLSTLETKTASTAFGDHVETLSSLLGAVDAIFWPSRNPEPGWLAQLKQVRERYHDAGMVWKGSSEGGSSRAWKSDARLRESLEVAGLVTLSKTTGNLPLVRMVPAIEHAMRQLIGLPTVTDQAALAIHWRLGQWEDTPQHRADGWCSECWLFCTDYKDRPTDNDWDVSTQQIIPLLVTGLVESKPSTIGHGYYRLTKPEQQLPEYDSKTTTHNKSLLDIYLDAFFAGIAERKLLKSDSEIVIPLSATK